MPTLDNLPTFDLSEYYPEERTDAAANRSTILHQARKLLRKTSIQELTMAELAAASGVGKGTLYRRFENKAALAKFLVVDDLLALQAQLTADNDAGLDAKDLLRKFCESLGCFTITNAELISATIMKEDKPSDWWLHTPVMLWLTELLAALFSAAAPRGDGDEFARNIIPTVMLMPYTQDERQIAQELQRINRLVTTLVEYSAKR